MLTSVVSRQWRFDLSSLNYEYQGTMQKATFPGHVHELLIRVGQLNGSYFGRAVMWELVQNVLRWCGRPTDCWSLRVVFC